MLQENQDEMRDLKRQVTELQNDKKRNIAAIRKLRQTVEMFTEERPESRVPMDASNEPAGEQNEKRREKEEMDDRKKTCTDTGLGVAYCEPRPRTRRGPWRHGRQSI